jgi:eukaryotic-like serine/threonine-protein kinase
VRERVGPYEILESLGRGGMARVDLARAQADAGFVRLVALKRLHEHLRDDATVVAMFHDEASLAARIRHANVVRPVDVIEGDGVLAVAFELVVGVTLSEAMRAASEDGLPTPIAARLALDLLEGLEAAHTTVDESGVALVIVHRDVSPKNVMIDHGGHAKVTDFGLAKARVRAAVSAPGSMRGTLSYMAPEQFLDAEISPRTDVYSASVVIWEMLSGTSLFRGDSEGMIVSRVLEGVVPRAGRGRTDVSDALADVVAKGLERRPEKRFAAAREMAIAIEKIVVPAAARDVAAWLEAKLGDLLEHRRDRVRAATRGSNGMEVAGATRDAAAEHADAETVSMPTPPLPVRGRSGAPSPARDEVPQDARRAVATPDVNRGRLSRRTLAPLAIGIVGTIALVSWRLRGESIAPPAERLPASSTTVAASGPSSSIEASASALPSALPFPSAAPSIAAARQKDLPLPSRRDPVQPASASSHAVSPCAEPTFVDATGIRRIKRECL